MPKSIEELNFIKDVPLPEPIQDDLRSINYTEGKAVSDNMPPVAPTGLTATAGIKSIQLNWTANTESDLSYYEIWRHTSDVRASASKIGNVNVNRMLDGGLTASQAYYYWLKAVDNIGNISAFNASAGVSATATSELIRTSSMFGDGVDGDVTISVDTDLSADKYYNDLTINSGKVLNTKGYRIFVKGTLTNNGTIKNNGGNGGNGSSSAGGTAGTGGTGGYFQAGIAGQIGGQGTTGANGGAGVAGTSKITTIGSSGSAGGAGGNGGGGFTGGAGGVAGTATATTEKPITPTEFKLAYNIITVTKYETCAGSGSGGGGGSEDNTNNSGFGGGSGGTGGFIGIYAKYLVNNGTISANGGNGGNGGDAVQVSSTVGKGGGGGGAGANGGVILLVYQQKTGAGTITITAGSAGTGGAPYGTGGVAGNTGTDGTAGVLIEMLL